MIARNDSLNASCFVLTSDIDCSATSISDTNDPDYDASLYNYGAGFFSIGYYDFQNNVEHSFNGTIDGNNHTISNLYINHNCSNNPAKCLSGHVYYTGFIWYGGPKIYNLHFTNVDITGEHFTGVLGRVVLQDGTGLSNISVSGNIRGNSTVGLLTGGIKREADTYSSNINITRIFTSVFSYNGLSIINQYDRLIGLQR